MKRYEAYKDSGVNWIGEIPEEWELINFRQLINVLTDFTANGSFGDLAKNVTYVDQVSYSKLIRLTDLRKELNNDGVYIDEKSHRYLKKSELFGGEILIANVGAYAGLTCIMPSINYKASLGPNMFLLKFKDSLTIKYAFYLLNSSKYWEWLQITALSSAQPKLNKENIRQLKIVLPPLPEQTAIAEFLDNKTAKIDQLIGIKQKEIELLKERRQILIQQAVTGKIVWDASTNAWTEPIEVKDSGVDWIGEIPEHWECIKLKFLGNAIIGLTYSPNDLCDFSEGTLVLRSSNLYEGKFVYGEKENAYVKTKIPEKLLIRENDILICSRNGSRDLIGKCAIAKSEDVGNSFGAFTTVFRSKYNEYLFCILNSNIFKNLSGSFLTSTINQLTIGNLYSIQVPIPPENEMSQIRTFVTSIEAKIAKAITLKEQEIEKLKEYKTVLIDNVVTGKVKIN